MKNKILVLGITALILGMLVLVTATPGNSGGNGKTRVFVSGNSISKFVVKNTFATQHEFKDGFTVEVDAKGLAALKKIPGIETEEVQLYHITGKPVCGNGIIEGGEKCGEPGLPDCPTGYVCENCKCVEETAPPERSCYPSVQKPWGIVKVNGGSGGADVKVAVLDTGVYKDHLDLKDTVVDCKDTTKRGIKNGCADRNGHGTHVAGTILADGGSDGKGILGVAPEAKLMAIKVCGADGSCWADDIAAGIDYAASHGANIISMSFGANGQSRWIRDAIASNPGVLFVAAAGNAGPELDTMHYPGANAKVMGIAALKSDDSVVYFSSRGINDDNCLIEEKEVEVAAPGVSVLSTWNDGCYHAISGTSMATPHVSGLAAKFWSAGVGDVDNDGDSNDANDVRTYIQERAKLTDITLGKYAKDGHDPASGFGLPIAS